MKRADGDLYLLQDGTYADPKECTAGKDGVLRHKNGLAVSLRADGEPMTLQSNAEESGNVAAAAAAGDGRSEPAAAPIAVPAEPAKDRGSGAT